jgi:hypothetical protein
MAITDSQRYREALLAAVDDDGLEELIEGLVLPDYPEAYRTGPGQDAGVDVLSDLGNPPQRAWQAKNHFKSGINWSACSDSLASAMEGPKPRHYTFVFPRKLRKGELKHWREEFHPAELARYEWLDELDFEDDLAVQLKDRPELVDEMSDGVLSEYLKPILGQLAEKGTSPLGTPAAGAGIGGHAVEQAKQAGKDDSRFAYGVTGREAGAADGEIPERAARFTMSHRSGELPSYSLTIREGDSVVELSAQPREGVEVKPPEVWFAPTPAGTEALMRARNSLAKGKPIELSGEEVAVRPKEIPEQFRDRLDDEGLLRDGTVGLGLSGVVPLQLTLTIDGEELPQMFGLYRVPPLCEGAEAYGGSLGGCCIFLDIVPVDTAEANPDEKAYELELSLTLAVAGETGKDAVRGLGFARAFTSAERLRFDSPELLPKEGIEIGADDGSTENEETWEIAAIVAGALAALEGHNSKERRMPAGVSERDRYAAQLTYQVLRNGGVEVKTEGQFWLPERTGDIDGRDPEELTRMAVELPPIAGKRSGVMVERQMEGIEVVEVVPWKEGWVRLLLRSGDEGGRIALTLIDEK